ncbi:Fic family protein [Sphingobacterium paucimobilis]|uniref:Fido domain-containing protein n=1 Tax=Sphingobacterium paucimobilis HER1398 TaxID=1346330 RepID=U2J2T7_9SPHI|nr:Fic family protein [Sphingobacterium paucimobilis]ERJ59284.1 hypothetical protein M472_10910 [Sphingobacterium paucimobilis HER1398]
MQKFRFAWTYHSCTIEGNSLTYAETKALLLHGITAQGKPLRDHIEITSHDEAVKWIEDLVKGDYPLTESFIRELHTLLLKDPYEVQAITPEGKPTSRRIAVGQYKTAPNHVKTVTGEIFRFATPEETPAKMHDLIAWFRSESEGIDINPIILAAEFHYRFIRIHPFDDGNGRTARIVMNFILMKYGYPPVVIKTEDKENYFSALRQADAGEITSFINYIAENQIRSLGIMLSGAKGENIEEEDDVLKELTLLKASLKKEKPTKSPALAYYTINSFIENIKPLFDETIEQISDLFAESNISILVNGEYYAIIPEDMKSKLSDDKSLEILGVDLYKQDISDIVWRTDYLGLKGANNKNKLQVDICLILEEAHPILRLNVGSQKVIQHVYDYESPIGKQSINSIQRQLLRNLTNEVKSMV